MKVPNRVKSNCGFVQNVKKREEAMDPCDECFVSGVLALVLRVSILVGAAPLNFVKKRTGWRVSVSPGLCLYGYTVVTVIILVTFGTLICDLQVEQKNALRMRTNTRRVVWIVDACLMLLIAGTVVYGAPGQMRSMIGYLNHVQKINYELNAHHWPLCNERKKTYIFVGWLIITVAITCIDFVAVFFINDLIQAESMPSRCVCVLTYFISILVKKLLPVYLHLKKLELKDGCWDYIF